MVEFCASCGTSLPKGDLTFRNGKSFTSDDYTCPSCNKIANPQAAESAAPEPSEEGDMVFKEGNVELS